MVYIAQQSFSSGEVDPNIRAQYESAPYRTGCQILENAYLSDTGSAIKRWGSTIFSSGASQNKGFSFVNSYGECYYILNTVDSGTSGYKIVRASNGTVLSSYSNTESGNSSEYVKDIASSGLELFVVTIEGIYSHIINNDTDKRRYLSDVNIGVINSISPVSLTSTDDPEDGGPYLGLKVVSSANHFQKDDIDTLWKLMPGSDKTDLMPTFRTFDARNYQDSFNPASETLDAPDYPYVSQTEGRFEDYHTGTGTGNARGVSKNDFLKAGHTVSNNTLVLAHPIVNRNAAISSSSNPYGYCRIYNLGGLNITYRMTTGSNVPYIPYKEGEIIAFRWVDGTREMLFETAYNQVTGTQGLDTIIKFENRVGGLSRNDFHPIGTTGLQVPETDQKSVEHYDWAGPYKNWTTVDKIFTNYNGSEDVTGVIKNATWNKTFNSTPMALSTLVTDATSGASLITENQKRALTQGAVGVIEQCVGTNAYNKTYFYVAKKKYVEDNGTKVSNNTDDPQIILCAGQPLIPPPAVDANNPAYITLKIRLASSSESQTANKTSDGLAVNRNGLFTDALVRDENYRVGAVGSPSASIDITSYEVSAYNTTTNVISSTTSFTNKVYLTSLIGDTNPGPKTNTFRVSKHEVEDDSLNVYNTTDQYISQSGSYYWKMTGDAFNPITKTGEQKEVLAYPEIAEYHQERLFISGFKVADSIKDLSVTQKVPLTVIASKSGNTNDFSLGANDGDGLSFTVASKDGGYIQWLKSLGNALFVGSDEEEFIIGDAPMTPTSLNISRQSNYGSREDVSAKVYANSVLYVTKDGKSIRSLNFNERTNRYESDDLFQYAKHLTKSERIKKIEVVHTATPLLMALTDSGKLYCFTAKTSNRVAGWSEWSNTQLGTFSEVVSGRDFAGNACLYARCSALPSTVNSVLITSDDTRLDYLLDYATEIDTDQSTPLSSVTSLAYASKTVSVIVKKTTGEEVYVGDYVASALGVITFDGLSFNNVDKVILGLPYTMKLAPNIPEVMMPGKGSTLGRDKNISRLRIFFNQVLGAVAAGYNVFPVPLDTKDAMPTNKTGFYSVPVVGQYGPQPTIIIEQSAPYAFEVSGYNAEYDFGD